jgi:dipeptidyl aminopeptidase/acylaminoacyl peptidase
MFLLTCLLSAASLAGGFQGETVSHSKLYNTEIIDFTVNGHRAFLIKPRNPAPHGAKPWLWYAPAFAHPEGWDPPGERHAWTVNQLLDKGFAFCGVDVGESYGNAEGRAVYQAFYEVLVKHYKLGRKACLYPESRGGLMAYNWAAEHPKSVQCIAGIYTVCDLRSYPGLANAAPAYGMTEAQLEAALKSNNPIDRLEPLARAHVPIFHVHGDADNVVPMEKNSAEMARRYKALGGKMEVLVIPGKGHEWDDGFWKQPQVVDFLLEQGLRR